MRDKLASISDANCEPSRTLDVEEIRTKNTIATDDRNWFVKSVHGRAVGGMVLGFLMIPAGLLGGAFTRANYTTTGFSLAGLGIVTLFFSTALYWVTRRPRN